MSEQLEIEASAKASKSAVERLVIWLFIKIVLPKTRICQFGNDIQRLFAYRMTNPDSKRTTALLAMNATELAGELERIGILKDWKTHLGKENTETDFPRYVPDLRAK